MEDSCHTNKGCSRRVTLEKIQEVVDLYENRKCPYNMRFKIQGCLLLRDREIEDLFKLMDRCRDEDTGAPCISGGPG